MKFSYRIEQDEDHGDSPRDWYNLGTMVCQHSRYNLGDEQMDLGLGSWLQNTIYSLGLAKDTEPFDEFMRGLQYNTTDEIEKAWDLLDSKIIVLPLYLYDHSGLTMSTGPFSCPWDSGRVGFIYVSIADVKAEWGWKYLTAKRRERIEGCLRNEVETYNQYLQGDVWGYTIEDEDGNHYDSCWGFYGHDYCEIEAKQALDYQIELDKELYEFERVV